MTAAPLPTEAPAFAEGREFRQLHPTREGARKWRFRTLKKTRLHIPGLVAHPDTIISCRDHTAREWPRFDNFGIPLAEDYTWNGCTSKRWVPLFGWIGTPDFRSTHLASAVHDALYQFHAVLHFPLHRSDCDAIFKRLIELNGDEEIAHIYHRAVRRFGSWSPKSTPGLHSVLL